MRTVSLFAVLFFAPLAMAGVSTTGGGDVFVCGDQVFLADAMESLYIKSDNSGPEYHPRTGARLNSGPKYQRRIDIETYNKTPEPEKILTLIAWSKRPDTLESFYFVDESPIFKRHKRLKYVPVSHVEELDDDNIKNIPEGCTKKQLAVQYKGEDLVIYNESLFKRLSPLEQGLFYYHEALIAEQLEKNGKDRPVVRSKVAEELDGIHYLIRRYFLARNEMNYFGVDWAGVAETFEVGPLSCELYEHVGRAFPINYSVKEMGDFAGWYPGNYLYPRELKKGETRFCLIAESPMTEPFQTIERFQGKDKKTSFRAFHTSTKYVFVRKTDSNRCAVLRLEAEAGWTTTLGPEQAEPGWLDHWMLNRFSSQTLKNRREHIEKAVDRLPKCRRL